MDEFGKLAGAFLAAIIGVAIVAVLVSKGSNTSGVIASATSGFSSILQVAVSPVTGASGGTQYASTPAGNLSGLQQSNTGGFQSPSNNYNLRTPNQLAGFSGSGNAGGGAGVGSSGSIYDGAGVESGLGIDVATRGFAGGTSGPQGIGGGFDLPNV